MCASANYTTDCGLLSKVVIILYRSIIGLVCLVTDLFVCLVAGLFVHVVCNIQSIQGSMIRVNTIIIVLHLLSYYVQLVISLVY